MNIFYHHAVNHLVDYGYGWFTFDKIGFNCRLISSRNTTLDLKRANKQVYPIGLCNFFSGTIPGYSGLVCFV